MLSVTEADAAKPRASTKGTTMWIPSDLEGPTETVADASF